MPTREIRCALLADRHLGLAERLRSLLETEFEAVVVVGDEVSLFESARQLNVAAAVVELLPGDIIFTGTPGGVGVAREPRRFLKAGEVLESWIEGIGTIRNRFVAPQS